MFVELNTELVSIEQDTEGVTAHIIKREGGKETKETFRTPFLIGADGAKGLFSSLFPDTWHLTITNLGVSRKQLGLDFAGVSRPSDRALVGDIYIFLVFFDRIRINNRQQSLSCRNPFVKAGEEQKAADLTS